MVKGTFLIKEFNMADEVNAPAPKDTTPVTTTPKEKKTRAPRKAKVVAEAVVSSAAATKTRGRGSKLQLGDALSSPAPVPTKTVAPAKSAVKPQPVKRGPPKVEANTLASDGFADLLKLEGENQKLRKALSEKLRAENADLRRKLGMA
jgi:hypothetical protein